MSAIQHVFRRDAVYWWRRRMPSPGAGRNWIRLELSLRTRSCGVARHVAAEVTLRSERLRSELVRGMISSEDAKKILSAVAKAHSAKLDAVAAADIDSGVNFESARLSDISMGWALKLFASQGDDAAVSEHEEWEMRRAGLDRIAIESVREHLGFCRTSGIFPPARAKIEGLLDEYGISETRVNYAQAQRLYPPLTCIVNFDYVRIQTRSRRHHWLKSQRTSEFNCFLHRIQSA